MNEHMTQRLDETLRTFVVEHSSEAIIVIDESGAPVLVNRAARELRGIDVARGLERGGQLRAEAVALCRQLRESTCSWREVELAERSGPRRVRIEGASIGSHIVAVVRDLGDGDGSEEELLQLRRLASIGLHASGVVHNLNNLLQPMQMLSAHLARTAPRNSVAAPIADEIAALTERCFRVVQQVLEYARRRPLSSDSIDVRRVVLELEPLIRRLAGDRVQTIVRAGHAACTARVNRTQLESVILNLVTNARDAMPTGGSLRVTVASVDRLDRVRAVPRPFVAIEVADDGTGIDPADIAHVFDAFFTTKGGGGSGLGLTEAQRLATDRGGWIDVTSARGRGTVVTLYLPIDTAPAEAPVYDASIDTHGRL